MKLASVHKHVYAYTYMYMYVLYADSWFLCFVKTSPKSHKLPVLVQSKILLAILHVRSSCTYLIFVFTCNCGHKKHSTKVNNSHAAIASNGYRLLPRLIAFKSLFVCGWVDGWCSVTCPKL